ncbi:hypothetical protein H1S01_16055 [Heliobacterium chlorum]|uniref:Uncharacterized protein n=1 Tax=Heliobacterium chlorum TaxID=2698 RepID=A0ABR7T5D9_HELCL|nr:hypothetical protein [Heliobacterium chlorum]MBC9785999.1 hypothetical protein [Heliobacterium chlorum]
MDGTFTFPVATSEHIGFAKDNLAAKPLVYMEMEDRVLLASEETSLRTVVPDLNVPVEEPPPFSIGAWSVTGEKAVYKVPNRAVI